MATHRGRVIRVTVEDTETGESSAAEMEDSYVVVTAGRHYVAHTNIYGNGTVVVTIKKTDKKEDTA